MEATNKMYDTEELAEAALTGVEFACAFIPPPFDVFCEGVVAAVESGGLTQFILSFGGQQLFERLVARDFCVAMQACQTPCTPDNKAKLAARNATKAYARLAQPLSK